MTKRYVRVLLLLSIAPGVYSQSLSPTEKKVIETVRQIHPETEKFLEKTVNINSGTLNLEGVRENGKLLADEFEKLGFKTEWVTLPDSLNRAGHLVAADGEEEERAAGRGEAAGARGGSHPRSMPKPSRVPDLPADSRAA